MQTLMKSLVLLLIGICVFSFVGYSTPRGGGASELPSIIVFDPDVSSDQRMEAVRGAGGREIRSLDIINGVAAVLPHPASVRRLEARPGVVRVDEDLEIQAHTDDPEIPWGVARINAPEAWDVSTGYETRVAILDTGIQRDHPDLEDVVMGGKLFLQNPPYHRLGSEDWDDDNGHGTHVAGTVAAWGEIAGVAPTAHLYAGKVLDRNGRGSLSNLIDALEWCIDENMQVVNMSLGASEENGSFHEAIINANGAGLILVSSAGNRGPGDDTVSYPAAYPETIAVAASDSDDDIASFSSRGEEVDITGPGVDIQSTWIDSGYRTISGTSMAAPHVSGVAALVIAEEGMMEPDEMYELLTATAEDLGHASTQQGSGLVDAAAALGIDVASAGVAISPSSLEDEAWPGDDAIYEFTVTNTGEVEDTYTLSTADSTWASSVNIGVLTLAAGASTVVDVTHSVPSDASPGDTDTGTINADSSETGASASAEFTTTARGYAVDITPDSRKGSGAPGDTVEYVYTVSNTGTEDDSYDLATVADWDSAVSNNSVPVNAGDSVEVTVSHTIPEDAVESDSDTGTLTADYVGSDVSASATFTTVAVEEQELAAPKIITFEVTTRSSGPWNRANVGWEVYHEDGKLEEVKSELLNGDEVVDEQITSVSGESAGGEHNLRVRGDADAIRLTVTAGGKDVSETKVISSDF